LRAFGAVQAVVAAAIRQAGVFTDFDLRAVAAEKRLEVALRDRCEQPTDEVDFGFHENLLRHCLSRRSFVCADDLPSRADRGGQAGQ
jgi:hypothetical protein